MYRILAVGNPGCRKTYDFVDGSSSPIKMTIWGMLCYWVCHIIIWLVVQ